MARDRMNPTASVPAAARLQLLSGYLEQDPTNPLLLADACEAAISCGRHEQAERYIATAQQLALDRREWLFRHARLCIARRALDDAAQMLEQLRADGSDHPVLAHDLGYVRLLQGDAQAAFALLRPWMQDPALASQWPAQQREAMQVLWLRACHRVGLLEEATAWVQEERDAGLLQPAASGVASLVALDLEDLPAARTLADAALAADPGQLEALVARGTIALAEGDTRAARHWLLAALRRKPDDGRTWSALGFASMMDGDYAAAQEQLARAVETMPDHVETWHALAWARLLRGDGDAAAAALRSALALDDEDADTHGALAIVLGLAGDDAASRRHLETAARLDPDSVALQCAQSLRGGAAADRQALESVLREVLARWRPRP